MKRHITSLVLIAIICFFIFFLRLYSLIPFDILLLLAAVVGGFEMYKAFSNQGKKPMLVPIIIYSVIVYPVMCIFEYALKQPMEYGILISLLIATMCTLMNFAFKFEKTEENGEQKTISPHTTDDLTATVFILIYPITFVMMFVVINHGVGGLLGILLILVASLLTDTFALFVGKAFGKRKLIPHISPNKTVAGAIGGIFGGLIGSFVIFFLFDFGRLFDNMRNVQIHAITDLVGSTGIAIALYAVLGLLVVIATESGDLVASLIKRKTGIKDFGKVFPGHGGVMDRLDALIFTMPIVYCFFKFII